MQHFFLLLLLLLLLLLFWRAEGGVNREADAASCVSISLGFSDSCRSRSTTGQAQSKSAAPGLWHDTDSNRGGGHRGEMKEGHTPPLLSEQPPPGPGVTATTTRPGDGTRHTGPPALPRPAKQHLGSVLWEQKAAAGWEGGSGGSAAKDQCCCGRHRCTGEGLEPTSCCPLFPE